MSWHDANDTAGKKTIMYYLPKDITQQPLLKLAGFDLDGTLIWSDHGEYFAGTASQWVFPTDDTPQKMQQFVKDGYTICLFSNRKGAPWMHEGVKNRIRTLFARLGFEFPCFLSVKTDGNRKPQPGMFNFMCQLLGVTALTEDSFYCGDAASKSGSLPWYRWSDADIGFAKATGLPFKEPIAVFGDYPPPPLPDKIQLIVTCGQVGAGWDILYHQYAPSNPITIPGKSIDDDRYLYFFDRDHLLEAQQIDLSNPKNVIMMCGSNPTVADRSAVVKDFKVTRDQVAIYWYSRPCHFEVDKKYLEPYIKSFRHPQFDGFTWYRAN
jgi:DNA 3'-phosphatase